MILFYVAGYGLIVLNFDHPKKTRSAMEG